MTLTKREIIERLEDIIIKYQDDRIGDPLYYDIEDLLIAIEKGKLISYKLKA